MLPSTIIIATATTNSSEDSYCRVKLKAEGIWDESDLVMVVQPLSVLKDERVYVDISSGIENPVVIGVVKDGDADYDIRLFSIDNNGDTLEGWIKGTRLFIQNSDGTKIDVNGKEVSIEAGNGSKAKFSDEITINAAAKKTVKINGHFEVS